MRKTHSYQWLEAACAPEANNPEAGQLHSQAPDASWLRNYFNYLLLLSLSTLIITTVIQYMLLFGPCICLSACCASPLSLHCLSSRVLVYQCLREHYAMKFDLSIGHLICLCMIMCLQSFGQWANKVLATSNNHLPNRQQVTTTFPTGNNCLFKRRHSSSCMASSVFLRSSI